MLGVATALITHILVVLVKIFGRYVVSHGLESVFARFFGLPALSYRLMQQAENQDRYDILVINYLQAMAVYSRSQIIFAFITMLTLILWFLYFGTPLNISILIPLVSTAFFLKDMFFFLSAYLNVEFSIPSVMSNITRELRTQYRKNKSQFTLSAVSDMMNSLASKTPKSK
jgi:hypothetical protein